MAPGSEAPSSAAPGTSGGGGSSGGGGRRRPLRRLPGDHRHPDRLEPGGRARLAVPDDRCRPGDRRRGTAAVTGPLVAAGSTPASRSQIRSGGPAIGYQTVTSQHVQRRLDHSSATSTPTRRSRTPRSSPPSPSYVGHGEEPADDHVGPGDVPGRAHASPTSARPACSIRYFGGAAYMEYFTQSGILSARPGRRQLRRRRRRRSSPPGQGRPAGLRLGRAVHLRARGARTG